MTKMMMIFLFALYFLYASVYSWNIMCQKSHFLWPFYAHAGVNLSLVSCQLCEWITVCLFVYCMTCMFCLCLPDLTLHVTAILCYCISHTYVYTWSQALHASLLLTQFECVHFVFLCILAYNYSIIHLSFILLYACRDLMILMCVRCTWL